MNVIGQSSVLKSDVSYCFVYILAPFCCTEMGWSLKHAEGSHFQIGCVPVF